MHDKQKTRAEQKPKRSLGQNFLIDKNIQEKIIRVADITKKETILEIGPGKGALTDYMVQQAKKVIAIEKDDNLAVKLQEKYKDEKNVHIINADAFQVLEGQVVGLPKGKYTVIANIPYNITGKLIRALLEHPHAPARMLLMIQKEVAQRITAHPGDMSVLAVMTQVLAGVSIKFEVSRNCFYPKPKVQSAIIQLLPYAKRPRGKTYEKLAEVVHAGFASKRKKLINNLAKGLERGKGEIEEILQKVNISKDARAQELSVKEWVHLTNVVQESVN